jgi:hypothetical protein
LPPRLRRPSASPVDRRVDLEPALIDAFPAEALHEKASNFFLEVLAVVFAGSQPVVEHDRRLRRGVVRGTIDHLRVVHRLKHDVATGSGSFEAHRGRIRRRRLDEPGEERRFLERDIGGVLVEVPERRGFDAVEPVTEIDLVEIERKNLVLRELTLEARRHQHFGEFSAAASCRV